MMIEEAYVSFETAKLLKEKGFDCKCFGYYVDDEPDDVKYSSLCETNSIWEVRCCSAPTHQMAMAWLRMVHNIVIVITPSMFWEKYNVSIYKKGNDYPIGFDGDSLFPSYEQACETVIKYCIENVI